MPTNSSPTKVFDLDERTFRFARNVRQTLLQFPSGKIDAADKNQVIRSSGSIGANFIEAREGLSRKDFLMRVKICRKEADETRYWLRLIAAALSSNEQIPLMPLIQESHELAKIFGSIVSKCERNEPSVLPR